MSHQQLKTLYDQGKFQEVADTSAKMIQKNATDKASLLFLAKAQVKLELFKECQSNLNEVYLMIKKPQDDQIHYQSLVCQESLFTAMLTSQNTPKQHKQQAHISMMKNKFEIIDFLDKKGKYDQMLEQYEIYVMNLLQDGNFKEVEDNYVWIMNHQKIPTHTRQMYGCRIFDIDEFYNPYTRIENLFKLVVSMGVENEQNQKLLQSLGQRIIDGLERQNCKKTVQQAIQSDQVPAFIGFCEQLKSAGDIVYQSVDAIMKNKPSQKMFARYLSAKSLSVAMHSEEWNLLINKITQLVQTDYFQCSLGDFNRNPLQLLLHSFLDVTKFIRERRFPEAGELFFSQHAFSQGDLDSFVTEYQEMTPMTNIYYAMCKLQSSNPDEAKTINARINQATFLIRKILHHKFKKQHESPDIVVFSMCLKIKLSSGLDKDTFDVEFNKCEETFKKSGAQTSKQIQDLYNGVTVNIKWQTNLMTGNWVQALSDLESLAKVQPDKANFAALQSCRIQFAYINQLTSTQEESDLYIKGLFNKLSAINDCDSLLMQGYLLYTFSELLCGQDDNGKSCVTKWLQALKLNQTNPDLYYSLAVHYYKQNEASRASKCLDKALTLRQSFEQAFILQFHLLPTLEARQTLLDNNMTHTKNLAVTFYLKGIMLQNASEYVQAIEMFQNSIKFHTIQKQKIKDLQRPLLPEIQLSIHKNPFGIYQNTSQVWVHLTECFWKIEKPTVAIKCFTKCLEEICQYQQQEPRQTQLHPIVSKVLEIIDWDRFKPSRQEIQNDPILLTLQQLQPSPYLLECLMLGSRLVPKGQTSIHILTTALRCFKEMNFNFFEFLITELLSRITKIVQDGTVLVYGNVEILQETQEAIERLQRLVDFVESIPEFESFQNLQKKQLNAMFVIAKKFSDDQRMSTAMVKAEILVQKFNSGTISRSFLLDAPKIIHECQRLSTDQVKNDLLQQRKMNYIRQAIMLEPTNPDLWVHLHLFSNDEAQKKAAIYKAYELNPDSTCVQEILIKHYLKTDQLQKAFKVLVKSYQQQITLMELQQPIVLAFLAYLNAKGYIEDTTLSSTQKRQQLLEALSLCRMVQRQDMTHLLSDMYTYLSHFSGDFLTTLKYFENKLDDDSKLVLQQAYFGSQIYTYEQAKGKSEEFGVHNPELDFVFNIEDVPKDKILQETNKTIQEFMVSPINVVSRLALLQEICLKYKISPEINLLDLENFKSVVGQVGLDFQRIIIIQCLRLIQQKEGKIPEAQAIISNDQQSDISQLNVGKQNSQQKSYTLFLIEAARLKPQYLTQQQHKNLLRLYLQSQSDPSVLNRVLGKNIYTANPQEVARIQALKIILDLKKGNKNFALSQMMKEPLSLEANVNWIWSLFRLSKDQDALKAFKVVKGRLTILQGPRESYQKLEMFVEACVGGGNSNSGLQKSLYSIAQIYYKLKGCKENKSEIDTQDIACNIAKILQQSPFKIELALILYQTLQITLFDQGHYLQFQKITKDLLNVSTCENIFKSNFLNEMWLFQGLNSASSLIQLKKLTQVIGKITEMESICKTGQQKRDLLPVNLLYARSYFALQNFQKVQHYLNMDDAVLERDFLLALGFYSQQAYKQSYLTTLGLVAGCKANQDGSHNAYWTLAYAYYLKAFNEMTFIAARKQNIVLQEDFKASDGEGEFNLVYFQGKITSSLGKCIKMLTRAGEGEDSVLRQAIKAMLSQV